MVSIIKNKRNSKWTFIIYKESAPKNYINILESLHIPFMLSPWHDKDIDLETGELLKPHKHGVFFFDSLKSYEQVSEIVSTILNSPAKVEPVHSPKGMYDYFIHASNPDKASYNLEDIEYGAGFEIENFLIINQSDGILKQIVDIIEENDITEFQKLVKYSRDNNLVYLQYIATKTFFFSKYLDSRRHSYKVEQEHAIIDEE